MKLALHTLAIACSAAMVSAASAHTLALASSEQQPSSDTEQTTPDTRTTPSTTSGTAQDTSPDNVNNPPTATGTDSAQPVTPDSSATQPTAPGSTTTPPPSADPDVRQGTVPGVAPATPPTDPRGDDTMAQEDVHDFLENAIQGSYAEIEGSQLALEKAEDPEVREFAEMMIRDHQQMAQEASDLARQKGMEPPDGPSMMQTTEITALKPLTGGAFEAMYVNRIGVAAHESTIEMFEQAQQDIQDPDVRAMIEKTLPKLREHLQMAQALDQKQENQ